MKNPRSPGDKVPLEKKGEETMETHEVVQLMNDFCELGGGQLNITGGEPLARRDIVELLNSIKKRDTRIILNSNVLLAERLLQKEKSPNVDAIYASLHTTKESDFKEFLGIGGGAKKVMDNMVKLQKHGYRVQINYSLGEFNKHEFASVMEFAIKNEIDLKAISLIRSMENSKQYGNGKEWSSPKWLQDMLDRIGLKRTGSREGFGGRVAVYKSNEDKEHKIEIKNVGSGRLMTDFCKGCKYEKKCGEGIYALRSGVDGLWKPCLLNSDKYEDIKKDSDGTYRQQILMMVDKMVGQWENHRFVEGDPQ